MKITLFFTEEDARNLHYLLSRKYKKKQTAKLPLLIKLAAWTEAAEQANIEQKMGAIK